MPRGHLTRSEDSFGCHNWKTLLTSRSRPQKSCSTPYIAQTIPYDKNYLPQNITRAKTEIPWSKHVLLFDHLKKNYCSIAAL